MKRSVTFAGLGLVALTSLRCMPDFNALSSGGAMDCVSSQGGCAGVAGTAGGNTAGGKGGASGSTSIAGTSGSGGQAGAVGEAGIGNEAGAPGQPGGGSGGSGGTGATGGSGGSGPCTTSFDPGTLLYSFDDGSLGGVNLYPECSSGKGVGGCVGPISNTTTAWNPTEGHSCPGALEMTVTFGGYESPNQVSVADNFGPSDWTTYKVLHAWVKLLTPATGPLTYLANMQFFVTTKTDYSGYLSSSYVMSTKFAARDWQEVKVALPVVTLPATGTYDPTVVRNIGVQVQGVTAMPAGGPATPPDTVVEIDDIWLE